MIYRFALMIRWKSRLRLRVDPFYSKENQEHLDKVISNYYDGKAQLVHKEISDLEEMEE